MAFSFWLFPQQIDFTIAGGLSHPSPVPVQKSTVDDSTRISWSPLQKKPWDLKGILPSSIPENGGITLVKFYARMFRSSNGPDLWDYTPGCNPRVMAFVDFGKDGNFNLSDCVVEGLHGCHPTSRWGGKDLQNYYTNLATNPSGPIPGDVLQWEWDVTSLATWTDSLLASMKIGVEASERSLGNYAGFLVEAGHSAYTGGANSPRFNISQLGLYVEAADPPIPYALGGSLVVV